MKDAKQVARIIEIASWCFALLGLVLPVALFTPPFAMYRSALEAGVGAGTLGDHTRLLGLVVGITGGSIAGKWLMHAALARFALSRGQRWARNATWVGLLSWFAVDSASSLLAGAWWNVVMVNALPLVLVGIPLVLGSRVLGARDTLAPPNPSLEAPARAVMITSGIGVMSGFVIAFGGGSFAFAPWFEGLAASGIVEGPLSEIERALALSFFGPIGGCVCAQFAMIVLAARGPLRRGARWVCPSAAGSIATWFLIDSSYGLAHGGLFNVAMVNVPTLILTLPPLAWAHIRVRALEAKPPAD